VIIKHLGLSVGASFLVRDQ